MTLDSKSESDPLGKGQHEPGAKLDAGKQRPGLVLGAFAPALVEVIKIGTFGACKYTDNGWLSVPNGVQRYEDALLRHWLAFKGGETHDPDSGLHHMAHFAWNALAMLTLLLRDRDRTQDKLRNAAPDLRGSMGGGGFGSLANMFAREK